MVIGTSMAADWLKPSSAITTTSARPVNPAPGVNTRPMPSAAIAAVPLDTLMMRNVTGSPFGSTATVPRSKRERRSTWVVKLGRVATAAGGLLATTP